MTALEYLEPRTTRHDALRVFTRRSRWRTRRWRPGRLELVYVPVYLIEATISQRHAGDRKVLFSVDALDGEVRRLDHGARRGGSPTLPGEVFRARLTPLEAIARAREEVPWLILPLSLRRARLRITDLRFGGQLYYPFWIRYLARRDRWDFEALDGLGGTRVGARGRARLLRAMLDQRDAGCGGEKPGR